MRTLLVLPFLLVSFAAHAEFLQVEADHANFLYTEGERANLILHLVAAPAEELSVEAQVSFEGAASQRLVFEEDNVVFQTPVLSAGERTIEIELHLIDTERRDADLEAISSTDEQIGYWTERLVGETSQDLIAMIQERIEILNAQRAALIADLAKTDQTVETLQIQLQVNPSE